ncbi:DUF2934 domain-containing protein [Nitrospirales bacterium NOB]|nr:MAG: hypothetical protein UZ03_NOB001003121 [Nitrospira sp. OLB3]MBV6471334.1 hypothetical protein [Nitrospirota bacterium]MCE7966567.1 DUF2934 domain-containing protein [Nitrospira sp. NTP2]MDL1888394.1 DUF2934 domain-containing protein [Nitrospirales bacterium NOB]MEB2338809.1 DUF2934 domain-containing protein [Nitrospirales bacterium]QOJ35940.1 MAG: DUF2934 domain-containing protein [Nitrospira sp.]
MLTPSRQNKAGQRRQASTRTAAKPSGAAPSSHAQRGPTSDELQALIAKRAYERYAEQGYRHGCALDDWLEAEREILSQRPPV